MARQAFKSSQKRVLLPFAKTSTKNSNTQSKPPTPQADLSIYIPLVLVFHNVEAHFGRPGLESGRFLKLRCNGHSPVSIEQKAQYLIWPSNTRPSRGRRGCFCFCCSTGVSAFGWELGDIFIYISDIITVAGAPQLKMGALSIFVDVPICVSSKSGLYSPNPTRNKALLKKKQRRSQATAPRSRVAAEPCCFTSPSQHTAIAGQHGTGTLPWTASAEVSPGSWLDKSSNLLVFLCVGRWVGRHQTNGLKDAFSDLKEPEHRE